MRNILLAFAVCLTFIGNAYPQQTANAIERAYCTQYGPFFLRFDPDKAAGVFAILPNNDLGAVVGELHQQTLTGEWIETDSRGAIRLVFSEDWSSFEAAYSIAPDMETWNTGWTGYLPPAGDPMTFIIDGETFVCR